MTQKIQPEEIEEAQKEEIHGIKERFEQIFDREAETQISNKVEDADLETLVDKQFISDLKQLTNSSKTISYIESMREQIEETLGIQYGGTDFNLDKYSDLAKNRIAQKMAEFAVQQMRIRPVDIDVDQDNTNLYQYDETTGTWDYFSSNKIGRLAKKLGQEEYTQHLENNFRRNLVNHEEFMTMEDMGLPDNEILLDNKKVLMLDTAPNYDTRSVGMEDYCLYKLNVEYKPTAECPRFEQFVYDLLDGKEKQIKTLQEYMGWMLKYPNNDFKKALIILGVTNSGKSQLADILTAMFNDRAVKHLSMSQLGLNRRFHVNKLGGAILNIDRDMASQQIESSDTIKQLISQEPINAEPKGEDSRVVDPTAKHFICSNVAPNPANGNDEAFYGRFLTLKAPNTVDKEDRVRNLGEKLFEEEGEGILNWMLEGLHRLEEQGDFTLSPSAYETKMMWNEYGDSAERFLYHCTEQGTEDDYITTKDLYEEYEMWVSDKLMSKRTFKNFVQTVKQQSYINKNRREVHGNLKTCFTGLKVDTDSGAEHDYA